VRELYRPAFPPRLFSPAPRAAARTGSPPARLAFPGRRSRSPRFLAPSEAEPRLDWYERNIPFFESPDTALDATWYYRWELVTRHLTYGAPETGYTFTEFIDRPAAGVRYTGVDQKEQTIRVFGDVGLVNGLNTMDVDRKGQAVSFDIRFLAVYVREGSDWRMRAWQSTRLP
jgi:hypothetical protein